MLIGDSRSGKSTLSETLRTGPNIVQNIQIYSQTTEPKINSTVIEYEGKQITLNIVDTPGLHEILPEKNIDIALNKNGGYDLSNIQEIQLDKKVRTDKEILLKIIEFTKLKVSDIDLVLFVYDINKGLSKETLESLARYNQAFPNLMNNCAIVFTRCEKFTEAERKGLLIDFAKSPIFHKTKVSAMFKKGVFFSGAIDPFLVRVHNNARDESFMRIIIDDISNQREKILQLIVKNTEQVNTSTLSTWCLQS